MLGLFGGENYEGRTSDRPMTAFQLDINNVAIIKNWIR